MRTEAGVSHFDSFQELDTYLDDPKHAEHKAELEKEFCLNKGEQHIFIGKYGELRKSPKVYKWEIENILDLRNKIPGTKPLWHFKVTPDDWVCGSAGNMKRKVQARFVKSSDAYDCYPGSFGFNQQIKEAWIEL